MAKQKVALAKYLQHHTTHLTDKEAAEAAQAIMDGFDLVPKGLIAPLIKYVQEHPYE